MYRHWAVQRMRRKARLVVEELFAHLRRGAGADAATDWNACAALDDTARARVVADYIAGMTDRFALQEHRKLTDPMVKGCESEPARDGASRLARSACHPGNPERGRGFCSWGGCGIRRA